MKLIMVLEPSVMNCFHTPVSSEKGDSPYVAVSQKAFGELAGNVVELPDASALEADQKFALKWVAAEKKFVWEAIS